MQLLSHGGCSACNMLYFLTLIGDVSALKQKWNEFVFFKKASPCPVNRKCHVSMPQLPRHQPSQTLQVVHGPTHCDQKQPVNQRSQLPAEIQLSRPSNLQCGLNSPADMLACLVSMETKEQTNQKSWSKTAVLTTSDIFSLNGTRRGVMTVPTHFLRLESHILLKGYRKSKHTMMKLFWSHLWDLTCWTN